MFFYSVLFLTLFRMGIRIDYCLTGIMVSQSLLTHSACSQPTSRPWCVYWSSLFSFLLFPEFKAIQMNYSHGWRRSTTARRSWRRSWGIKRWLTWRLIRKWTVWSLTSCSSGRSEINTCCKSNLHHLMFKIVCFGRVEWGKVYAYDILWKRILIALMHSFLSW